MSMLRDLLLSIVLAKTTALVVALAGGIALAWLPIHSEDRVVARGWTTIGPSGTVVVVEPRAATAIQTSAGAGIASDGAPDRSTGTPASVVASDSAGSALRDLAACGSPIDEFRVVEPVRRYGAPVPGPLWRLPVRIESRRAQQAGAGAGTGAGAGAGAGAAVAVVGGGWAPLDDAVRTEVVQSLGAHAARAGDEALVPALTRARPACDRRGADGRHRFGYGRRRSSGQDVATLINGVLIFVVLLAAQSIVLRARGWARD